MSQKLSSHFGITLYRSKAPAGSPAKRGGLDLERVLMRLNGQLAGSEGDAGSDLCSPKYIAG